MKKQNIFIIFCIIAILIISNVVYCLAVCTPQCVFDLKGAEAKNKELVSLVMCKGLPCTSTSELGTACCSSKYGGELGNSQLGSAGKDAGCTKTLPSCQPSDMCTVNRQKHIPAWTTETKACQTAAKKVNIDCNTCYNTKCVQLNNLKLKRAFQSWV